MPRRIMQGTVVSDKGDKTIIVQVDRQKLHPLVKKVVRSSEKFAAHDPENSHKTGDRVQIRECSPISKRKRWEVITGEA
jgi:small subunit ribosomal protein S17